ncbi:MAG: hypothetical protein ABIA63_09785 [bacterium]
MREHRELILRHKTHQADPRPLRRLDSGIQRRGLYRNKGYSCALCCPTSIALTAHSPLSFTGHAACVP